MARFVCYQFSDKRLDTRSLSTWKMINEGVKRRAQQLTKDRDDVSHSDFVLILEELHQMGYELYHADSERMIFRHK